MNIIPDESRLDPPEKTYSYMILDSVISAETGIKTYPFTNCAITGIAQLTLDNVDFTNSQAAIRIPNSSITVAGGQKYDSWAQGVVVNATYPHGTWVRSANLSPKRNAPFDMLGGPNGGYFERSKPNYGWVPVDQWRNALDFGCKGDGTTDDTKCLNDLISQPGHVFLPAGVYVATDTVRIGDGVNVVGEVWSQIMASGPAFSDMSYPKVLVQGKLVLDGI